MAKIQTKFCTLRYTNRYNESLAFFLPFNLVLTSNGGIEAFRFMNLTNSFLIHSSDFRHDTFNIEKLALSVVAGSLSRVMWSC